MFSENPNEGVGTIYAYKAQNTDTTNNILQRNNFNSQISKSTVSESSEDRPKLFQQQWTNVNANGMRVKSSSKKRSTTNTQQIEMFLRNNYFLMCFATLPLELLKTILV